MGGKVAQKQRNGISGKFFSENYKKRLTGRVSLWYTSIEPREEGNTAWVRQKGAIPMYEAETILSLPAWFARETA